MNATGRNIYREDKPMKFTGPKLYWEDKLTGEYNKIKAIPCRGSNDNNVTRAWPSCDEVALTHLTSLKIYCDEVALTDT
jgi:hypothetical protein